MRGRHGSTIEASARDDDEWKVFRERARAECHLDAATAPTAANRRLPGSVGAIRALLLAAGALRNARNAYGATALDIAMREGRDDAADALRDA